MNIEQHNYQPVKEIPNKNLSAELEALGLPKNVIFLDVNGTLIPEDSPNSNFDMKHLNEFKQVVLQLKHQGFEIGLCSDSPIPELLNFSQQLGLDGGPTIAENGNIIVYKEKTVVVNELPELINLKHTISEFSQNQGWAQVNDVIASEFGGIQPNFEMQQWAFGAHRITSISVFGNAEQINLLGELLKNEKGISIDCAPEYNFLGVHPGSFEQNKGFLLGQLAQLGHEVLMVGNSQSDWVDPSTGVKCSFVAEARLLKTLLAKAHVVSQHPLMEGVIDILRHLNLTQ